MPDHPDLPETDERLSRKIKQRLCLATRNVLPKGEALRFVLAPDGALTLDLSGKLPGRGANLTPTKDALETAIAKKAFARAFKQPVEVPADYADHIERLMRANLISRMSMARRSGSLAVGQDAIFAAAGDGKLCLLIVPVDASSNAVAKLSGIARDFPSLTFGKAEELAHALGKERVSNLGFTNPYLAEHFLTDVHKFRDFLGLNPHDLPLN